MYHRLLFDRGNTNTAKNTLKFRFVMKKRLYNTLALNYYF